MRTQHNGTYPLNYAALCKELPWDIHFWHNSLAYWIEAANIIPHYTVRNLLDSTGILELRSQTIGLCTRNGWAGRTGLDFWRLTNAQLYLHTPCFPTNTPSCAKASHETLLQPNQRGLITVASWVKLRIWLKRSPGVSWMTEQHKNPVREIYLTSGGWEGGGRCFPFGVCFERESQTGNWSDSRRWIWFVITSGGEGMTHFSESWLWESVQASLSTLSACNPTLSPTQPRYCFPPCQEHNKYWKALQEYPWDIQKMLCWQTWMWGWFVSAALLLPFLGFIQLYCSLKSKKVEGHVILYSYAHL